MGPGKAGKLARTRVLLVGMPRMLRQLLRGIVEEVPVLEIVGEFPQSSLLSPEILELDADFIIVGADYADEDDVAELLVRSRRLKVLGLSADGHRAVLYELRPHRVSLGELSPSALIKVIARRGTKAVMVREEAG